MSKRIIVTIGREFGTGGRKIATRLGEKLGINVYDKKLLDVLKQKYNLTGEEMDKIRAKKKSWWSDFKSMYEKAAAFADKPFDEAVYVPEVTSALLYREEEKILKTLAEQESCIILGRTGYHIFREDKDAFRVFLIADMPYRRDKVARRLNINEGSADVLIKQVDEARENFSRTFSGSSRYDAHNYDLVINVTGLDSELVAQMIADCIRSKKAAEKSRSGMRY
mgnify:CR=1 FL=1